MKPILKSQKLAEPKTRITLTAVVESVEVKEFDCSDRFTATNEAYTEVKLLVTLSNGYSFFTPVIGTHSVAHAPGIVISLYHDLKEQWATKTKTQETKIGACNQRYDAICETLKPTFNTGDEIKIKGTIQTGARLNRVVML